MRLYNREIQSSFLMALITLLALDLFEIHILRVCGEFKQ